MNNRLNISQRLDFGCGFASDVLFLICLSDLGRHEDRTSSFRQGRTLSQPAPNSCLPAIPRERVFCVNQEPAEADQASRNPRAKGRRESRRSFGLGSLNPALETLAGLALKVPFLHRLESSIRTPCDSIKAADQNHRFTGFTGESRLFGSQGCFRQLRHAEEIRKASSPHQVASQMLLNSSFCPTAGGKEALRISSRWRNSNLSGRRTSRFSPNQSILSLPRPLNLALDEFHPMRLLPRWRLSAPVLPLVGGRTRAVQSGHDLRSGEVGKLVLEGHGRILPEKKKCAMHKLELAGSVQCIQSHAVNQHQP